MRPKGHRDRLVEMLCARLQLRLGIAAAAEWLTRFVPLERIDKRHTIDGRVAPPIVRASHVLLITRREVLRAGRLVDALVRMERQ